MEQSIVSTFMFSEPHEQELLWLKFNVEDPYVARWVVTESSYTFQGQVKPLYVNEILAQERFAPFRHKVHLIQLEENYNFQYEISCLDLAKRKVKRWLNAHAGRHYELVPYAENASFHAEIIQRQACVPYLVANYPPQTVVFPCDADEILDLSGDKQALFEQLLHRHRGTFYVRRLIFCYDYNNLTPRLRYSPLVRLGDLRRDARSMQAVKHPQLGRFTMADTPVPLVYEYTFCFSKEAIRRKLSTFAHVTDLNASALDYCLDNNIALINPDRIGAQYLRNPEHFYTTIPLNEENSPAFLRDHFDHFRTGVVNPRYEANRQLNHLESHH